MAETAVQKIVRETHETTGAIASMNTAFMGFVQYVKDHLDDPAALETAATELQAGQDTLDAAVLANPLPGEVVVVPPVEPPVENPFLAKKPTFVNKK